MSDMNERAHRIAAGLGRRARKQIRANKIDHKVTSLLRRLDLIDDDLEDTALGRAVFKIVKEEGRSRNKGKKMAKKKTKKKRTSMRRGKKVVTKTVTTKTTVTRNGKKLGKTNLGNLRKAALGKKLKWRKVKAGIPMFAARTVKGLYVVSRGPVGLSDKSRWSGGFIPKSELGKDRYREKRLGHATSKTKMQEKAERHAARMKTRNFCGSNDSNRCQGAQWVGISRNCGIRNTRFWGN